MSPTPACISRRSELLTSEPILRLQLFASSKAERRSDDWLSKPTLKASGELVGDQAALSRTSRMIMCYYTYVLCAL